MERLNYDSTLDLLRRANSCFSRFFARFSGAPVLGTADEVNALLRIEQTLRSVGALLKTDLPKSDDQEIRAELASYRENLLRLRHELAVMQGSALGCQARLFARGKHLHAAQAWCAAARDLR